MIDKYLQAHTVKDFGFCIQYDTLKATIIGSYKRLTYYKDDIYYFQGLEGNQYHKRYKDDSILEIPLFAPI